MSRLNKNKNTSTQNNVSNNLNGLNIISEIPLQDIDDEIKDKIWKGELLSEEARNILDHVTSKIKNEQLEAILKSLRSISIPEFDPEPFEQVDSNQEEEERKKKLKLLKQQQQKQKKKGGRKKKGASKKKIIESDDDEDVDQDEDEEEKEDEIEKEDQQQQQQLKNEIKYYRNGKEEINNDFKEFLQNNQISSEHLIVFLYWIINTTSVKNQEQRFNAASIYVRMITLERKLFHPFAFRSVMKLLYVKSPNTLVISENKSGKSKGKGKEKDGDTEMEEDEQEETGTADENDEMEEDEQEEDGGSKSKTQNNEKIWFKKCGLLLQDLSWSFYRFDFSNHNEPLCNAIESITQLARTQNFKKPKAKGKRTAASDSNEIEVIKLAFEALSVLVEENRHAPLPVVLSILLKEFLPTLSMNPGTNIPPQVPKSLIFDRDLVLEFIFSKLIPNRNTHDHIYILIQHICMKVLDRSEYKTQTVTSVSKLLTHLYSHQRFMDNFFITYSKNVKSHFRSFSVEVSLALLHNFKIFKDIFGDTLKEDLLIQQLLGILVDRSSDKVSVVRSKALICLSTLLEDSEDQSEDSEIIKLIKNHLNKVFILDHNGNNTQIDSDDENDNVRNSNKKKPSLLSFLSKRSQDEKAQVRKSALQVLDVICSQSGATKPILNILLKSSQDSSPLVRKQVIITLSKLLLTFPKDLVLVDTWRKAVIPLITDREQTIVDKSLDSINEILFNSILNPQSNEFIWVLLHDISVEMKPYLHKICNLMSSKKLITPQIIKSIQSIIKSSKEDNIIGGWTLFSEIAYCCPEKLDQHLIIGAWNKYKDSVNEKGLSDSKHEDRVTLLSCILLVIETICPLLSIENSKLLFNEIYAKIKQFAYEPIITQLLLNILVKLTHKTFKDNKSQFQTAIAEWTKKILQICDERLSLYALPNINIKGSSLDEKQEEEQVDNEEKLGLYLFTIGEIIQIPQAKIPTRLKTVVQALIAPKLTTISNNNDFSDLMVTEDDRTIPVSIRAHAFITLGKLCLGDDRLAKKCIATFAKELEISDSPIIRNNVMVVMCDLCIRYTQLVDNYIPNIAMCLRDPSEMVRRQTLVLLTRLLQEDYVKWKGSLFFRFVEALVDPSPIVKQFANYCLMNVLQVKYGSNGGAASATSSASNTSTANSNHHGNVFFTHFLESIFVLNNCKAHPNYNQISANPTFSLSLGGAKNNNGEAFQLSGSDNFSKRMQIYSTFLNNMRDEHKFQLMSRLCHEILSEISEERFNLEDCNGVIHDTLSILACKEIKLALHQSKSTEEDDLTPKEVAEEAAKSKLLTNIFKKNVIENIVPIVIELKHLLEKKRSKHLKLVMVYLKELLKDYKKEMTEYLSNNRQLEKEIEFDMRNLNNQNRKPQFQSPSKLPVRTPAKRLSIIPNQNSPSVNNTNLQTPAKIDKTNFAVPPSRVKLPGSAVRTPISKPFAQGLRLSFTPSKTPLTGQSSLTSQFLNESNNMNSGGSANKIPMNSLFNQPQTPKSILKPSMRHSIGGIPLSSLSSSAISPSPYKSNNNNNNNSNNTTPPSTTPIKMAPLGKNIVLPNIETTPSKWNIKSDIIDEKSSDKIIDSDNEEEDKENIEENITIKSKRGRPSRKQNLIDNDDETPKEEEPSKVSKSRGRISKKQNIENSDSEQKEEEQEEETPKVSKSRGKSSKSTVNKSNTTPASTSTSRSTRNRKPIFNLEPIENNNSNDDENSDFDEKIKQSKKRTKTSNVNTGTTTTTRGRKKNK
ncbi:hypothetical protein DICPUDRAFT_147562 [Dictyostelium purpureum]|uniref:Condensin complex subunit 1 C-terminal domain-containing protein n=1 Tax=Dictyostelium purpureum TaxID=5786 RepID=F0Z8T7_DICPU|nr:uncharacterized protein DICPUDRAFT_147562 [Dictyostelium purpureum]EGC39631.1 hypothetical protein DICPUDRAFT_147562 [Dictyostelium purpureum]|eukprot:XP_003283852.1 hypothetical protein DICPUDRAFT_147562 [Dictyostelium purpureum]